MVASDCSGVRLNAIVSLHDVMPETFAKAQAWVQRLCVLPPERVALLVVPGRRWSTRDITTLRRWQSDGFELAAHGWSHHLCHPTRGLHTLHRILLSRTAGEHLGQQRGALIGLLGRSHAWFEENGLQPPELYVPPAWAMGALRRADMNAAPFRYFETISGLIDTVTGERRRLPLLGYEADTRSRALFLSAWNLVQRAMHTANRPLRLSIHPFDDEMRLSRMLDRDLERVEAVAYRGALCAEPAPVQHAR